MSQLQPPYARVYGSPLTAVAHSIPECANNLRRMIMTAGRVNVANQSSTGPRYARSERDVLRDLNKDFIGIFDGIKDQLSQCELCVAARLHIV
jgi:hypothetical protein